MKRDEIARFAYENVPFYVDLHKKGNSWEDYPVIDKKTMLIHMDSVFAPQYMGDLFANKLERVLTSGSTGECFEVFWKKSHIMKSLIPLWNKRKRYYNISPDDLRCYFFTTKIVDGKEIQIEESDYGLGFSKMDLCEDRVIAIYNHMLEFNPRWLIVQPSMLILLTTMAKKHGLPPLPDLTYIELTGESITESARKSVREFFGCEVASQYGCYEVNSIACECPYGGLHVMSENVFVETVGEDDLCITSLQNKVMPFIRYKIGDKGKVIYEHSCSCGSREPMIDAASEKGWKYILYYIKKNNKNNTSAQKQTNSKGFKRAVLWGMALHSATDTYAHSAQIKSGRIKHTGGYTDADDKTYIETRYLDATAVARKIMNKYAAKPRQHLVASDLTMPGNHTIGYELISYQDYMRYTDTSMANYMYTYSYSYGSK